MQSVLIELWKHILAQGFPVQNLVIRVCRQLKDWNHSSGNKRSSVLVQN